MRKEKFDKPITRHVSRRLLQRTENKRVLHDRHRRIQTSHRGRSLVGQETAPCIPVITDKTRHEHARKSPRERLDALAEAWQRSGHPMPNWMVTINLPRAELEKAQAEGMTVARYSLRYREFLGRELRDANHPVLFMWVLETKNHPHMHLLLWLPDAKRLMEKIIVGVCRLAGVQIPPAKPPWFFVRRKKRRPVDFTPVDPKRPYRGSDRTGFEGLVDYLGKSLEKTAARRRGRKFGKLVGASKLLMEQLRNN